MTDHDKPSFQSGTGVGFCAVSAGIAEFRFILVWNDVDLAQKAHIIE